MAEAAELAVPQHVRELGLHTCTCPGMTVGGRLVLLLGNLMEGSATLVSFARFTRFTKWPSVKKWDF